MHRRVSPIPLVACATDTCCTRNDHDEEQIMTATETATTTTYTVDPAHSSVEFAVKHLGIATVKGNFDAFEGTLVLGADPADTQAHGTVETTSVNTKEATRDEHLRSADFFDAANHPQLAFRSTEIRPVDDETFDIVGELTMHGIARELTLRAELQGTETDPWGNERVGVEISGQLNRSDWDMKFNQALGSGNVLVSDKVKLSLEISAVKQS
jgi:polyisoprenoid-binding protein YceI